MANFTLDEIEECNNIMEQDKNNTNFSILECSEVVDDTVVPLDLNKLFSI